MLIRNLNPQAALDLHSQPLDLDFNCISSNPTIDFSKKSSPNSTMVEPIYGNKATCELNENSDALLEALNGTSDLFANGLSATDRLSGDYDINSVLPPPKSRELAIGESYSDIGKAILLLCLCIFTSYDIGCLSVKVHLRSVHLVTNIFLTVLTDTSVLLNYFDVSP